MAYNIVRTNGSTLVSLDDGDIDNRVSTGLVLVGKNYSGYGLFQNENFVKLLENFASGTAPSPALTGQLYYSTTDSRLQYYDGTRWKVITSTAVGSTTPAGPVTGDLWWDTSNTLLKAYNGSSWTTVGPYTPAAATGSGESTETILDGASNPHIVTKHLINNQVVAITSKDTSFTPLVAISGFANVNPGITVSTTIANAAFYGNSTNSLLFSGLSTSQFLRSDQNSTTTGTLTVANNNGITVGASGQFSVYLDTAAKISSNTDTQDMIFQTKNGGVYTAVLSLDASTASTTTGGNLVVAGHIRPTANLTYDIGSSSYRFGNVWASGTLYGAATTAYYADLAEIYETDAEYEIGTVVMVGGEKEVTLSEHHNRAIGVISANPAYLMNSAAKGQPVALKGRVPVKVKGQVNKGDRLVADDKGVAVRAKTYNQSDTFAIALVQKDTEAVELVEAIIL